MKDEHAIVKFKNDILKQRAITFIDKIYSTTFVTNNALLNRKEIDELIKTNRDIIHAHIKPSLSE